MSNTRPMTPEQQACEHDYEDKAPLGWEYEWYVCKKCGHSYKLYYDEMR